MMEGSARGAGGKPRPHARDGTGGVKVLRRLPPCRRWGRTAARPLPGERADALARRAVERLGDDERLRADLTDDSYGPLLSWLSRLLLATARRREADPDAEAIMEAATAAARVLVAAVSRAAASGDVAPIADALAHAPPELLTPAERARVLAALPRDLAAYPSAGARARRVVEAMAAAPPGDGR